jgi:hypothetical protein
VTDLPTDYSPLRQQLLAAAEAFAAGADGLSDLLAAMVDDVERAEREPLEIFPVCHHSPASALNMVKRLQDRPPKLILMEGCEDLTGVLEMLRDCSLPVALQAFANEAPSFPADWAPLSVVFPLTEFSAEYQAIAYALDNPDCELVFIDRSADHIYQWLPKDLEAPGAAEEEELDEDEEPALDAVGVEVGRLEPTTKEFLDTLLANARVRHFQEWWAQYVEQAVLGADLRTYRQVFFLVASLLRRLGRSEADNASNLQREAFMWTRIKEHLARTGVAPEDAIYICGAIHAVSPAPEFGLESPHTVAIEPRTETKWLYGVLPSSYTAIERQFGHPRGTIRLADETWGKATDALKLKPFALKKKAPKAGARQKKAPLAAAAPPHDGGGALFDWLSTPPALGQADDAQLLRWCVDVVGLARKNGYLASTADAISIYEHSILLARMRNRRHPTPYDFRDASVTCLEKDRVPRKRNVQQICDVMLGGDREGQVGYASMPPLVQDVIDRLAPLGLNLMARTIQRALVDYRAKPELIPCSDLLWRIQYLLGTNQAVRPIMGEKVLGRAPAQESWDLALGKKEGQQAIIPLAYEGVTVEQVLEKRIKKRAFRIQASADDALEAAEAAETYLDNPRLVEELGDRAVWLVDTETGEAAEAIFERVRRLVHYYRAQPGGLPRWLKDFVAAGYRHYASLLPNAFEDQGTRPRQVAAMLAFLFTLEGLALSLGCSRSQVLIALKQAADGATAPEKLGLLWASEWLVGTRDRASIREFFDAALDNPLMLPVYPGYVAGFLLALGFAPAVAPVVVEALSKAFGRLPPHLLMPWMPGLIMTMRQYGGARMAPLIKEAARTFPRKLSDLDSWTPAWESAREAPAEPVGPALSEGEAGARALLFAHRKSADALAAQIGTAGPWVEAAPAAAPAPTGPALSEGEAGARALLFAHRDAADALAAQIGTGGPWGEAAPAGAPAAGAAPGLSPEEAGARALLEAYPEATAAQASRLG